MSRTYTRVVDKQKSRHNNAIPYVRAKVKSFDYDKENYNAARHSY